MKNSNYKKWTISLILMFVLFLVIFMIFNYIMDFYGYFRFAEVRDSETKDILFKRDLRKIKMKYIAENPDEYDGFIIGGSKSGALSADLVSEYEGRKFYNLCVPCGCFEEYKNYISYLVNNTSAQKIILHLGSVEVLAYSQDPMPATITSSKFDDVKEFFSYLIMNPAQIYQDRKTGSKLNKDGSVYYKEVERRILEEEGYIRTPLLSFFPEEGSYLLWRLFYHNTELPVFDKNIMALSEIVNVCNSKNVELEVIIGPTYLYELYKYEGDQYWSYLRQIASLTTFWDFSGFLDENRNPYNFVNSSHYNSRAADEMINIIYGKKQRDGFGVYVTPDTFEQYINDRMSKFSEMKGLFDETGTIPLIDDATAPSFIN